MRKAFITVLLVLVIFSIPAALAQATPSPTPIPSPGGISGIAVTLTTSIVAWTNGLVTVYGGSTLFATVAITIVAVLLVFFLFIMRRPRKPLDTHAPL